MCGGGLPSSHPHIPITLHNWSASSPLHLPASPLASGPSLVWPHIRVHVPHHVDRTRCCQIRIELRGKIRKDIKRRGGGQNKEV